MEKIDTTEIIEKHIKKATSPFDLLKWLVICKFAMEKLLEFEIRDQWVRDELNSLISDLAKLILSIRSSL